MHQTWAQSFDTKMLQDWMKQQLLKADKRIQVGKQVFVEMPVMQTEYVPVILLSQR